MVPATNSGVAAPHIQASIFNCAYLRWYLRCVANSMRLILQTLCQIQRISSRLRYVNCGPGNIQCNNSSTYSGFNNHLNVSPPLLEIYRQFNVRYSATMVPNTGHILQFTLCQLWSRPYTMWLQLLKFGVHYSTERMCAAIGDISTILCALYCKSGAKYSAHPLVYAVGTVVPAIYNVITVPHI
jgi:hypothetical protein